MLVLCPRKMFNAFMSKKLPGVGLVGIAAPTCAGKTELLSELCERLPKSSAVLSFDEYDLFPSGSEAMERELVDKKITNWEDPGLFDMRAFAEDVGRIAQGYSVNLQTRSRESIGRGENKRLFTPARVNFIEGIFVLIEPEVRVLMDETFYIDIPLDVMVERRLERSKGGTDPWDQPEYITGPMVEATREFVLPQRDLAGVVLNGLRSASQLADQIIQFTGRF